MMLLIAIISIVAILSGCLWDIYSNARPEYPSPRIASFTIGILAWWQVEPILSIFILIIMIAWLIVVWISKDSQVFRDIHEH